MSTVVSSLTRIDPMPGVKCRSMIERTERTVVGAQFGDAAPNQRSSSSAIEAEAPTVGATFATAANSTSTFPAAARDPCTVRVA